MLFLWCIVSRGFRRGTPTKGLFVKSPLESQKLRKNKVVYSVGSSLAHLSPKERCVRIFKGLFTKSPLKQGPLTQFQHILTIKKRGEIRVFVCIVSWGFRRGTPTKGLFVKSPLEAQKLRQSKVVYSCESSLAYLSPKERCVLWLTFLSRKVSLYIDKHIF